MTPDIAKSSIGYDRISRGFTLMQWMSKRIHMEELTDTQLGSIPSFEKFSTMQFSEQVVNIHNTAP